MPMSSNTWLPLGAHGQAVPCATDSPRQTRVQGRTRCDSRRGLDDAAIVPPTDPPAAGTRPFSDRRAEGFAQVYDLALERARRSEQGSPESPLEPVIPITVLEEMEAASRMFHALHAQGHELRFEGDPDGPVRAELRTVEGTVVRPVSLREAVDVTRRPGLRRLTEEVT